MSRTTSENVIGHRRLALRARRDASPLNFDSHLEMASEADPISAHTLRSHAFRDSLRGKSSKMRCQSGRLFLSTMRSVVSVPGWGLTRVHHRATRHASRAPFPSGPSGASRTAATTYCHLTTSTNETDCNFAGSVETRFVDDDP